jgi:hypothetical protein
MFVTKKSTLRPLMPFTREENSIFLCTFQVQKAFEIRVLAWMGVDELLIVNHKRRHAKKTDRNASPQRPLA